MSDLYPVTLEDLYPGTTFHYGKNAYNKHLHIILTDPEDVKGEILVVMVNLTTMRQGADTTVILDKSDHPFIKHPSVVAYIHAELFNTKTLLNYLNAERSLIDFVLEDEALRRVQQGLLESEFTPIEVLEYCQNKFMF
ncbi:hypothetical protein [Picosynechococcus sp. PCC 8807]|uniref:hypothetical protein n=1 Tax=Picosynechococcus sp. PCC 8807 TaxID=195248 RepID=UPI0008103EEE|nr:hypothetical protein [Picosynechococcus sp. PCC 8807]ANV90790.1 hypothetical protein AWQ24_09180 [Picosynechococcus sp. PCC 8807]